MTFVFLLTRSFSTSPRNLRHRNPNATGLGVRPRLLEFPLQSCRDADRLTAFPAQVETIVKKFRLTKYLLLKERNHLKNGGKFANPFIFLSCQ